MDLGDFLVGIVAGITTGTVVGMCVPENRKPGFCKRTKPLVAKHVNRAEKKIAKKINRLKSMYEDRITEPVIVNREQE